MNYEHITSGQVISDREYRKLTPARQAQYEPADDDSEDDGLGLIIAGASLVGSLLSNDDNDSQIDSGNDSGIFDGFDNGDTGGAGAGGDW